MSKNITIYTRSTCAPCKALKMYLGKKDIQFTEVDVDENSEATNKIIELSGQSIVPTTIISTEEGKEIITGLNLTKIMSVLAQ